MGSNSAGRALLHILNDRNQPQKRSFRSQWSIRTVPFIDKTKPAEAGFVCLCCNPTEVQRIYPSPHR